jgi:hypothetical protein
MKLNRCRIASSCLITLVMLSRSDASSAADVTPDAANLSAYALGQSYERTFQDYLEPGTCGIVLERQRCRDDFAAVKEFVGTRKMDAQVSLWLKDGDLANRISAWEGAQIPDQTWKDHPSFGWWYVAGALSVAAEMPRRTGVDELVSSILDNLTKHADAAPQQFSGLIDAGGAPQDRAKRLLDALHAAVPPTAFPAVASIDGDAGYAQLGILSGCVGELIDNPMALSRPESRLFALAVVDKIEAFDRKLGGSYSFDNLRLHLRGIISSDNDTLTTDIRQPFGGWAEVLKGAPEQRDAYLFGTMTTQTAYNAAILKDKQADETFLRGFISQTKPYARMSDKAKAAVHKMQDVPYGDWQNINAAATDATLAIMGQ